VGKVETGREKVGEDDQGEQEVHSVELELNTARITRLCIRAAPNSSMLGMVRPVLQAGHPTHFV
jgi:hypothetical protein